MSKRHLYRPPVLLSEFGGATSVGAQFRKGLKSSDDLRDAISVRLRREYERASKGVLADLYDGSGKEPPSFSVTAKWKQKQLDDYAKRVSRSMTETMRKAEERIAKKYPLDDKFDRARRRDELDALRKAKQADLEDAIASEAHLQATADQLVHSGAVNPKTAKIMYFRGPQDAKTCGYCSAVIAGNPWTIDEATNYGARLHPHCRHEWESNWEADEAELAVTRRRIRDGELKGWRGSSTTPAQGSAREAARMVQQHGDGWPLTKRQAVRQLGRSGVPEDDVNALLNAKERKTRERYLRRRSAQ